MRSLQACHFDILSKMVCLDIVIVQRRTLSVFVEPSVPVRPLSLLSPYSMSLYIFFLATGLVYFNVGIIDIILHQIPGCASFLCCINSMHRSMCRDNFIMVNQNSLHANCFSGVSLAFKGVSDRCKH